jgi:malonyl-CoA/methylmalonyl-CoA synthetase
VIPLVERARLHASETPARTALVTPEGAFTYGDLLAASARVAERLLDAGGNRVDDLEQRAVAYLLPPGFSHVAVQWGIWRAGGLAVPLATMHPRRELAYVLDDSGARVVVGAGGIEPELDARLRPLAQQRNLRYLTAEGMRAGKVGALPDVDPARRALMVYTSGTTGRPKGVVTTHLNLAFQIGSLVDAWGWGADDRILNVLPLHHVHGIVNVLCCALWSGAVCEMLPSFDPAEVWHRFERGGEDRLTLFMAVPTIYARLLSVWETALPEQREIWSRAASRLRLMVSGSAALPVSRWESWREVTGHVLLERYGMTEIGMALSNPLEGERRPGTVGRPLPGVEVRRTDEQGRVLGTGEEATPGELEVRGGNVFLEYWRRPEATREAFRDGWFRTGDVAVVEAGGYHRLLGRKSVDIVKTGGYKVSALEIEEVLRGHPAIEECAVVGVPDPEWGQRVAAAVVARSGETLSLEGLRAWAKERLAAYKVPSRLRLVPGLPRNALGKVTKPAVVELFETPDADSLRAPSELSGP